MILIHIHLEYRAAIFHLIVNILFLLLLLELFLRLFDLFLLYICHILCRLLLLIYFAYKVGEEFVLYTNHLVTLKHNSFGDTYMCY